MGRKLIKLALASSASLIAMTAHAYADFVFTPIAFALFAGPLGGALSFAAIYTGLQVAAYAAVVGAQMVLGGRQQSGKIDPGEMKNTFQEAETSEYNAVGRVKLGGLKAFGNTKGSVISRLIWHSKGQMVGIEQYYLGGREITVESDGEVSSPPWSLANNPSWANIKSKIGDGTETAWPELMADFPDLWTPAHRVRGIFQSLVRFRVPNLSDEWGNKKFQKLYQGGAPDLEVVARVGPIYDPRAPGQSPDNSATWAWSDNGILCAVHIMRHYPDLTSADFDWAFLADEANRADVVVTTKHGTEPRARCWGVWPSESQRGEVMQQVLDSIGAEVVIGDTGLIRIRLVDDAPISEIHFEANHIVDMDWKSGPDAVERPNLCRIKYYSPERSYDMGEIDMSGIAWARIDDEISRYGEKIFDVELPFCPSASQAQRIARRLFLSARANAGTIRTNMAGLAAWGVTYADIDDDIGEETMLCRISPPRIDDEAGKVDIPYIVWPPELIDNPWNPATMEADPPIAVPELQYESELDTPAAPSAGSVVRYPDNSYETRVKFAAVSGGTIAEAVYRTYPGGQPAPFQSMTEYNGAGVNRYGWVTADTSGGRADFKCRFFNNDDEGSYYSPLLMVDPMEIDNSAPNAPAFPVTVTDDGSGNYTFTCRASVTQMHVARLVIERWVSFGGGTWQEQASGNGRPEIAVTHSFTQVRQQNPRTVQVRAIAYASDGTASLPTNFSYTIPGDGGP